MVLLYNSEVSTLTDFSQSKESDTLSSISILCILLVNVLSGIRICTDFLLSVFPNSPTRIIHSG